MPIKVFSPKSLIRLPDNDVADCVVLLKNSQTIHLFGSVYVRKLVGSLSIYGHDLNDQEWHAVCAYSPNVVTIECQTEATSLDWQTTPCSSLLEDIYTNDNKPVLNKISKKLKDAGCILLLKSNCVALNVDCGFDISVILKESKFEKSEKVLHEKTADLNFTVFLDVPPTLSPLVESPDWPDISTFVESPSNLKDVLSPVILVCGGKGVGKSTFGRFVINKILNTEERLCFLETDVGQSEFTPPGVLSLHEIEKPIFGPPFSHLTSPKRAYFFGDVSPKNHPSSYVRFIHDLYQYYKDNHNEMALLVNTHGWVKGMGVRILLDIFRIVQPTHIIQINSESEPTKNLPKLDNEFLMNEAGWNYAKDEARRSPMAWKCPHLYQINAFKPNVDSSKRIIPRPSELRSMSLMSYFGSFHCTVYSQPIKNLKFYNVYDDDKNSTKIVLTRFIVCYDLLPDYGIIEVLKQVSSRQLLYSLNGSIVGLVNVDDEMNSSGPTTVRNTCLINDVPIGEYVGLGIVRNIDPTNGILFIMTPEPSEKLRHVNALVKGQLEIPDTLLKKRKFEMMPYVTSEFTYNHKGSGQKKIRYNLLRQTQRSPHPTDSK